MNETRTSSSSLFGTAIRVLLVGLCLVGAAGAWLHTESAFHRLLLPLVSRLTDAQLQAESGRLSWPGRLEIRGLRVARPGLRASLPELAIELDPLSCLPGRTTRFRKLVARGGEVDVVQDPAAPDEDGLFESAPASGARPPGFGLPVYVERAKLTDFQLTLSPPGDAATLTLGPSDLSVEDLVPGGDGHVEWTLPFRRDSGHESQLGVLAVNATLSSGPEETSALELAGRVGLTIRFENAARPEPRALSVALLPDASLTPSGRLTVRPTTLSVSETHGELLLELGLNGRSYLASGAHDWQASGTAPALARILALWKPPRLVTERLRQASVSGSAGLHSGGRSSPFELTGELEAGPLLVPFQAEVPLRHRLKLETSAALPRDRSVLELGRLALALSEEGGPGRGRLEASGRLGLGADGAAPTSRLALEARGLAVARWAPLLAATLPPSLGALPLDGEFELSFSGGADFDLSGTGSLAVEAAAHPELGQDLHVRLRPKLAQPEPGLLRGELGIEAPGADGGAGSARLSGSLDTRGETPHLQLTADLESLDLTAFVRPALAASRSGPPAEGAAPSDALPLGNPIDLDTSVRIGAVRVRETRLGSGHLTIHRSGGDFRLELGPTAIGDGSLWGDLSYLGEGADRKLGWELQVRELDLGALVRSLHPDLEAGTHVEGVLTVESAGSGRATAPANPIEQAEGQLDLHLRDARFANTPLLRFLVSTLGLDDFATLEFSDAEVRMPIREGRARVRQLDLGSGLAHLAVDGELGVGGVDLVVNPRLGPGLAEPAGWVGRLVGAADGLRAIPVDVTLQGRFGELSYDVRPHLAAADGVTRPGSGTLEELESVPHGETAPVAGETAESVRGPQGSAPDAGVGEEAPSR